jgi:ankyrin repeat protein
MKYVLSFVLGAWIASGAAAASTEVQKLIKGAEAGDNARIETLLVSGLHVDSRDKRGFTPLMYASASDHVETIALLIRRGAKVNAQSDIGETALICAIRYGNAKPETVKALLDAGAGVNVVMKDGATALTWANKKKRPAIVAMLTQAGAH